MFKLIQNHVIAIEIIAAIAAAFFMTEPRGIWSWINSLPDGAANFLGSSFGAGLGLIAILLGALFNAHLGRKRDDRLAMEERKALAASLLGELIGTILSVSDRRYFLLGTDSAFSSARISSGYPIKERMALDAPLVFEANAGKIGILGYDLAADIARIHAHYNLIRNLMAVAVAEHSKSIGHPFSAKPDRDRYFQEFLRDALSVAVKLGNISGKSELLDSLRDVPLFDRGILKDGVAYSLRRKEEGKEASQS